MPKPESVLTLTLLSRQRELGLEAHACDLGTHELLTQREKLWVLMFKNQNLDGVTQLVECLPSMKSKAKPEFDPQHHWRRGAHSHSQHWEAEAGGPEKFKVILSY